ncbi:D-xylose-NADP dehydrogenase [Acrasis kona]|uniref:D-xylose 1-dehydrogenase (NADP(+), D-xylono-1,5-lactone-forming) n=1 Tax=Acrasis kona TaxID=1008807 RepID=A0AAW2ZPJ9_9EUKA
MVRFGVLGTGRIAHDFVSSFKNVNGSEIVSVGSRNKADAQKFAEEHNIPNYGTYDELVSDKHVDVVYIATPHSTHCANTLLALNANKHVLCEKTFAMNTKQAKEMVETAKNKNLFIMEANWMLCFPLIQKTLQMVKEGVIGDVQMLHASLGFNSEGRELDLKMGGGSLLACGIYPITFATVLFGAAPSEIQASGSLAHNGADEQVSITLTYNECRHDGSIKKKIAILSSSFCSWIPSDAVIIGSKGTIRINDLFVCPNKITISVMGRPDNVIEEPFPVNDSKFNFPNSQGLSYEADHVAKCIQGGLKESYLVPTELTLRNMNIIDRVREIIGLKFDEDSC